MLIPDKEVQTVKRSRNLLALVVLVSAFASFAAAQEKATPISYDLKVRIEPPKGDIAVQGRLEIAKPPHAREFSFGLHETFAIQRLLVDGHKAGFSTHAAQTPMTPATMNVTVTLPDTTTDRVHMDMEYAGHLKEIPEFGSFAGQKEAMDDQINSRMVELASYSSWYPQFAYGQQFQIQMEVSLPQGWISICSGKKLADSIRPGRAITRWSSPKDTDILVLASRDYKERVVRQSGTDIEIYHTKMPETFIAGEAGQIAGVVGLFTDRLGETTIPGGSVKHVYSPKRYGQGMAGIARPGIIATSEGRTLDSLAQDPNFSLFQGIAHEIAHFWWHMGRDQGDWINEAFAEYFSAVAVQKTISEEKFQGALKYYRQKVAELPTEAPPLSKIPFLNDQVGFVVRYYKGALMLDDLRATLGDQKFFQACHDFFQKYKDQAIGTPEFRSFWRDQLGERQNLIEVWIDSPGGVPSRERTNAAAATHPSF